MKAAVTGPGSAIGARLVESFRLGGGPSVAAIGQHAAELTYAARFAVDLRVADFLDAASLARSFAGCSVVVHAATPDMADVRRSIVTLCRAAAQAGVRRIVFVSTAEVHGAAPPAGTDEKTPLVPEDLAELPAAYALAEKYFCSECRGLEIAGYVLRPALVYGPRSGFFGRLAAAMARGEATLSGTGEGVCNVVYVDHVVNAIRLALKTKTAPGSAYVISDGEEITWRDFYHAAAQALSLPIDRIRYAPAASRPDPAASRRRRSDDERFRRTPDKKAPPPREELELPSTARQSGTWKLPNDRARRDLGYQLSLSLAQAMERSAAWWRFAQGDYSAVA